MGWSLGGKFQHCCWSCLKLFEIRRLSDETVQMSVPLLSFAPDDSIADAGQCGLDWSVGGSTPWQSGTSKEDGTDN